VTRHPWLITAVVVAAVITGYLTVAANLTR
jgi:hypothetical protein